jgi:hypothetical protein
VEEARFSDSNEAVTGSLEDGKLFLAGQAADFHLGELKGTGRWGEHQLSFTARKAN